MSGRTRIQVLNLSNGTIAGPVMDTGGKAYDWFDLTASNKVVGLWLAAGPDPANPTVNRPVGIALYNPIANNNWQQTAQLTTFQGHTDRGKDVNGDEIIVIASADDPRELCGNGMSGVLKVKVSDGATTCLLPFKFEIVPHVSLNNKPNGHSWALISTYDPDHPSESIPSTAAPPSTLDVGDSDSDGIPNWAELWGPYYNELLLVKTDGSEKRRLAHHRSREIDPPSGPYAWQPKAALSRDGRYVLFDSNFAQPSTTSVEYADVYLIDTQELQ